MKNNKEDLINKIQESIGTVIDKKEISQVLSALPNAIKELVLKDGSYTYKHLAKFELVDKEATEFFNPRTKAKYLKPASKIFKIRKSQSTFKSIEL